MNADLDTILGTFERMRAGGIDLSAPLRWGFYFVDPKPEPLERVFAELEEYGYEIEALAQLENDTGWMLHVCKTEVLAPDKLHRRNVSFNELAVHCEAALYDGWEVAVPKRT
jgi:hypothetical protein